MKLFDLHADTATRLFYEGLPFTASSLHLSAADIGAFESHTQVFACFTRPHLTDDTAYRAFYAVREHLFSAIAPYRSRIHPILAVEDARLLSNDRRRLFPLYRAGVRLLTLLWRGETRIGGAYDTKIGLSRFGKSVMRDAQRLGIVTDASHASEAAFYDMAEEAEQSGIPFICSHSNAMKITPHPRNLTDAQFRTLCDGNGLCGLSLCPEHLSSGKSTRASVLSHLEHFLSLGGERTIAIGSDFDGIPATPQGLNTCRDLRLLAEDMTRIGYPDSLIEGIFYKNAEAFFRRHVR